MGQKQRYKVIERIAAGGMAEVFLGESAGIEGFCKRVAIKRVLPKLSANTDFINMFLDEARLCAYLSHSRCVQVFDIGEAAGSHFIVMEYVDGADLKEVVEHLAAQRLVLPVEVACLVALQVCEGLAYAHDAVDHTRQPLNIVHRDISPHNVLITRHGEVKLVDFGLARASSHLSTEDEDIVKGKFGYLAPEVTLGKAADRRVDIFAAGILLWEMLAGQRLFLGDTDLETFRLVQAADVPDLRGVRPDVNDDVAYVLAKALAREREHRYESAADMARDLGITLARLGRPVTYLDLAAFVVAAADERAQRKRAKPKAPDLVGDIILETLHDFSVEEEPRSATPLGMGRVAAASGEFVDPTAWGFDQEFGDLFELAQLPSELVPPRVSVQGGRVSVQGAPPPASSLPGRRSAAERARHTVPPPNEKGAPWWRRWFG